MKYVGDEITVVRRDSNNTDYSATNGIPQADMLRFINWGQEQLQALILRTRSKLFQVEREITLAVNTESITIPDRLYIGERIINVEYSPSGQARDYYEIKERAWNQRYTGSASDPVFYIRRAGELLLNPIPSRQGATVRVTYERMLDSLCVRHGQVMDSTIVAGQLTTLDVTALGTGDELVDNLAALAGAQYLCINDKYGNVTMYNIAVSSYAIGAFTFPPFTFASGETIADFDYVTVGKYTTTHSKLNDFCERYIETYGIIQSLGRDSRNDLSVWESRLSEIKKDVITSYEEPDKDDFEIQVENPGLILCGD